MNEKIKSQLGGIIRHVITAGSGYLAANPESVDTTIAAVVFLVGLGWSAWEKYKRPETPPEL